VRRQGALDLGHHGVGDTSLADADDGLERVRAGFQVGAFAGRQNRHKALCQTRGPEAA
jgi:hypothetical protein